MPLYFAYGSNMDRAAMAQRCPASTPLGTARLARHRFFIMVTGYASVARDPSRDVHGVLWNLAAADVAGLDAYEEVDSGLFVKARRNVVTADGVVRRALVYIGGSLVEGAARPGYLEAVVKAGREWGLEVGTG